MSDHDTWNMFAAASYAAWMAGGDYAAEECRTRAVDDADWFLIESKKRAPAIVAPPGMSSDPNAVFTNAAPFRGEPTPPQPDDDGLLPCPFCGGEAEYTFDPELIAPYGHSHTCRSCCASSGSSRSPEEAVAAWNRRIVSEAGVTK